MTVSDEQLAEMRREHPPIYVIAWLLSWPMHWAGWLWHQAKILPLRLQMRRLMRLQRDLHRQLERVEKLRKRMKP